MFNIFDKTLCFVAAIELAHGNLYCSECKTYVYSSEFLTIARELMMKAGRSLGVGALYRAWEPSPETVELLKKNPKRRRIAPNCAIGKSFNFVKRKL